MQSKLNEILELCIDKSNDNRFYEFKYRPDLSVLIITTVDINSWKIVDKTAYGSDILDQALEYMQNE